MPRSSPFFLGLLGALAVVPSSSAASGATVLIESSGLANKRATAIPVSPDGGVIAVISSPGSPDILGVGATEDSVSASSSGDTVVISAPGATLGGAGSASSSLAGGSGASAASVVAGAIVLSGVTEADVEAGLIDTRHGRTLTEVFSARINMGTEVKKQLLIVAMSGNGDLDEEAIRDDIEGIFDAAAATAEAGSALDDLYDLEIISVGDDDGASKVMATATAAASRSSLSLSGGNVSSAVAEAYAKVRHASADPPSVAEAILACDDAYARHSRSARAKLTAWKSRVARGLTVEKFGPNAEAILKRTVELYDRDTMTAAGFSSAAPYRLELRSKLQMRIEKAIRDLFAAQVANIEKKTLKKFNAVLLRKHDKTGAGTKDFYDDNAAALRSAAFMFDTSVGELEIPSLSLTKAKSSQDMNGKLNSALIGFPDSPAAQLKNIRQVKKTASKQRKPTERAVDAGLDLVAMIRPDGFGSLQGYAGYQLGGNSITVGVHNDADAPEVVSQFGGVRPPFIRIQPKLRLDVEL